jgi:hypothetical protein
MAKLKKIQMERKSAEKRAMGLSWNMHLKA